MNNETVFQKASIDWQSIHAAVWRHASQRLRPIPDPNCQSIDNLLGLEKQKKLLIGNTRSFVQGTGGNHTLLWGARGCGKSTLIRAMLPMFAANGLRMIQLNIQALAMLEEFVDYCSDLPYKFILLCDELSLTGEESSFLSLKVILEGSLERVPDNVLIYASSNHRHLLPEYFSDNEGVEVFDKGELHFGDSVESKLALADRFGLWISFYSGSHDDYVQTMQTLLQQHGLSEDKHMGDALNFARQRGVFSFRTAQHFLQTIKTQAQTNIS